MINDHGKFHIEEPFTHITAHAKTGKTSLAVSLTIDALIFCRQKVLYFSPGKEKANDIRYRMIAAWREWPLADVEGILENPRDTRHQRGLDSLLASFQLPIIIRDEANISFEQFRKWCLWHAHYDKIDLIIVDDFHLIKEGEKIEHLHELQRIATMLHIPCIVFTPLPRSTNDNLRNLARLNVRLSTCTNLSMWLARPIYEINAQLEITKAIGRGVNQDDVSLSFNPRSSHFEDVENIGMHLHFTLAGM